MTFAPQPMRDPLPLNGLLALGFVALAAVRLQVPATPYFDEVHYLPAARAFLAGSGVTNLEHPPLAKLVMAAGIALFGDQPLGWRLPSLLAGGSALFAAMRAVWLASGRAGASVLAGLFIATNFLLFIHARIAMLDVFMAAFVMLALWQFLAAMRRQHRVRLHLALAGMALGAAMAAKWNAIVLAPLPGLLVLVVRARHARWRVLIARDAPPLPGIPLWEAGLWLGALPLAVYALSFTAYLVFPYLPQQPTGLIDLHRQMLAMQTQVPQPHPYQSVWWQWLLNLRAVWYLYEFIDGAQRGVMLIGNPLVMLAGLPALLWCLWAGLRQRRADALGVAVLFAASMALWVVAPKPVQFYFHYLLPSLFLCAGLGLAVERLWQRGERLVPGALVAGSVGLFGWFYPILTAAPLASDMAFERWAWLAGWI